MATNHIPFEIADEYFFYDPFTGSVYWKKATARMIKPGQLAGWFHKRGYREISFFGKHYRASNIAWLIVTGVWPCRSIDHIDRDPTNDRWENLRLATQSQNCANQTIRSDNTSGYRGVTWDKVNKKWRTQIAKRRLGRFENIEDAAREYDKVAKQIYGEFANLNFPEA